VFETGSGWRPIGTGFFVSVPTGRQSDDQVFAYAVTARHVIDGARGAGHDTVYLRVNGVGGGVKYAPVPIQEWKFRSQDETPDDVAITGHVPNQAEAEYKMVDLPMIADAEVLGQHDVGVGDEVFLPGLFVNHVGTDRNLPIIRLGNVAATPSEPVSTGLGPLDAYLVEARSIGGLSGSPVFVNIGLLRIPRDTMLLSSLPEGATRAPDFLLLGLMHGHFQVKNIDSGLHVLTEEKINMGIAIVVPAARIIDAVNHPDLVAIRHLVLTRESENWQTDPEQPEMLEES
jgi:hypothetical protein